ncbi:MAG: hypothetical protein WCE93_05560, partial [Nitrososphaeraceae archaeon]
TYSRICFTISARIIPTSSCNVNITPIESISFLDCGFIAWNWKDKSKTQLVELMLLSNTIARTYSKYAKIKIVLFSMGLELFH